MIQRWTSCHLPFIFVPKYLSFSLSMLYFWDQIQSQEREDKWKNWSWRKELSFQTNSMIIIMQKYIKLLQNTTTELAIGIKETNITLERRALDCLNITKHVNNTVWQTRGFLNDRRSPYSFYNSSPRTYPSESLVLVVWGWPSSSSSPSSGTRVPTITSVYKSTYIIVNTFFFNFFLSSYMSSQSISKSWMW